MRKVLFIIGLLMANVVCASDYLFIEDVQVNQGETVVVPVKAHFDNWVSVWQFDIALPEGVSIVGYQRCDDMDIVHLDSEGNTVVFSPLLQVGLQDTRYLMISMEPDYDEDGNFVGVCKYTPGRYEMWLIELYVDRSFSGGQIITTSITACGRDTRPWVIPCDRNPVTHTTTIVSTNSDGSTPQGSNNEFLEDKQIKSIRYYNTLGQEMNCPDGITIVVTEYADGTKRVTKVKK